MLAPARSEMPTVTLDRWIYVSGGFGGPARLERYNPSTDQWQSLATMPGERHHLMSSAYDHRLYVFGGAEGQSWTPTNTVWQYDPDTDQWRDLVSMPESRLAGTAVTLGDKVYIVGGIGGSEALLEFTPIPEAWHLLPGPRQPREHVSAVAFQDEVWVLGGRWHGTGELATVEIYSPVTNTWRDGPTLNVARAGFGAAVVDDHIVVAGGEVIINGTATLDSVEILSAGSRNWQFGPRMSIPMHGVGGAALEGQFLLLGGSLKAGAIQNAGQVQIYEP
jgi:N-acetylneuraminic acid mutarotase